MSSSEDEREVEWNETNIDFIVLGSSYTHRIIDNYSYYFNKIDNYSREIGQKFMLYGVYTSPHSYGYNNHPLIYPTDNISIMEEIKMKIGNDVIGGILIKNCDKHLLDNNIVGNLVNKINNFCAYFDINEMTDRWIKEVNINGERLRILFLYFDTESG